MTNFATCKVQCRPNIYAYATQNMDYDECVRDGKYFFSVDCKCNMCENS